MRVGALIGGYRLLHQIGEGGMGVVWMATHTVLGRRAAVKILRDEYSMRHDIVARFFNEARAATAIPDPGIIQIFDVGHHTSGSAYIVMELLDGEPLDCRLQRMGVLPIASALRLCRQVASAVGAAHACGIVHRDLKPDNIFIVRDPEVAGGERAKVLDFGIAKLADDFGSLLKTSASTIIGTPPYMSPEQCRGAGQVDRRSDVYSLGCVLFKLITGRPPFDSKAPGVLLMQHMSDPPPRASVCAPGVPPEVDQLVMRCLAKRPDERFDSGTELALAIEAIASLPSVINATQIGLSTAESDVTTTLGTSFAGPVSPTAPTPPAPSPPTGMPPATGELSGAVAAPPVTTMRHRGRWYGVIAAGAVIGASVAMSIVASRRPPQASTASATLRDAGIVADESLTPDADPRPVNATGVAAGSGPPAPEPIAPATATGTIAKPTPPSDGASHRLPIKKPPSQPAKPREPTGSGSDSSDWGDIPVER